MSFPRDAYPYTNFHELNLGYFIVHFREIFSQWADLYDQMLNWKDATDEELATWKSGVEDDLDQREEALRAELETWKAQTGQDIAGWEDATLAALTAWQTATQAVFEAIRVEAAGSASAAAASAGDAATAKTAAETAQAAAEAAAASIQASAAQITTNTEDIANLKTQLISEKIFGYTLPGGTSESWSKQDFYPERAYYEITVKAFTVRSSLTDGYVVAEIYTYSSAEDTTGKRIFVKTKGNYISRDETVQIDNTDGVIYKVTVSLRPQNGTTAQVIFNDVTLEVDDNTLKNDVVDIDKKGLGRFSAFNFIYGNYNTTTGIPSRDNTHRISSKVPLQYDRDITITPADGWHIYVNYVNQDNSLSPGGWYDSKAIPKNQKFMICVARTVENTSEVLDINETLKNITINSVFDDLSGDVLSIQNNVDELNQYMRAEEFTLDYSTATIDSTYQAIAFNTLLKSGQTYNLEVNAPDPDSNTEYFNFFAGTTKLNPSAVGGASGSRIYTFTNSYGQDVTKMEFVLVKVNAQNTYTLTITNKNKYIPGAVEAIEEQLSELSPGEIPSYAKTNLESAVSTARNNMISCGLNGESFVFISDVHWTSNTKNSPALIGYVTKNLPIENVVYGGDTINGGTQAASIANMADFGTKMSKVSPTLLSLFGNHDTNALDGGTEFTHNEFYTLLQKYADNVVAWGGVDYFYRDNPTTKTRYICLDSGSGNGKNVEAQTAWLNSVLANTPAGWHIIVFVHVIYLSTSDIESDTITSFMQGIITILDAYNADGTKAKVEAIFGGHTHLDADKETTGGIPIVLIDCDSYTQTNSTSPHNAGTFGEQAFDIVTVDYSGNIYCTRVGRGSNRTITY